MGAAGTFKFLEGWTAAEIDEVEEFITAFGAGLNKRNTYTCLFVGQYAEAVSGF